MSFSKLWTRLFTKNTEADNIALHVAGATVRHKNPFEHLEVPRNDADLGKEFIEEWVLPFYMKRLSNVDDVAIGEFADAGRKINIEIVQRLLGDFNWRARIVGAYFAAINNYNGLLDVIGKHLLKSEVCFAGYGYCLALATFGGEDAKRYLASYLDYYLERLDLWFDQAVAFCALEYLDEVQADERIGKWDLFVAGKPYWDLSRSRASFTGSIIALDRIRTLINPTEALK